MARAERTLIQIETDEDANSVRDRLSFMRGQKVLLVWPEEGTALTRKLDLVLIQREAMRRAIRLALVTHDLQVIKHAQELNISTFETIGASERGRWKRGRSKVFTNRFQRPKDEPEPEELMGVASRIRVKRQALSAVQRFIVRVGILALLIGVVVAVAYVVVPGATIALTPAQQQIEIAIEIAVNSDPGFANVDVENAILPATRLVLTIEETASIATTGSHDLGSVRAIGTVIFINNTNNEVEIPPGTTVSTSAGTPILFRTTELAALPPGEGEQVEVPIEAMSSAAGEVGNVGENLINTVIGPLEESVTVRNLIPTTGGQTRVERAVIASDRERLLALLRQQIQERAYNEMLELPQVRDSKFVIIETLRIAQERDDWTNFTASPGDITDTLSLTMRAVVEAVAIDEQLGQQIVFAQMAGQIPRGRVIQPETIEYTRGPVTISGEDITFTMTGRGTVTGRINHGQLQEQLAGRSLEEAMLYLTERVDLAENSVPSIAITPDWFNRMPLLPMRINIIEQEIVIVEPS
jgi:hypothetical protein